MSTLAFELKEIDWSILGIVSLILLGVIILAGIILTIDKFVIKNHIGEGEEVNEVSVKGYILKHLTELIFGLSFIIIFVLLFAGKFYLSWEYGDNSLTDEVNFYQLIFGGNVTLVNKSFTLKTNPLLITSFVFLIVGTGLTLTPLFLKKENKVLLKTFNTISLLLIVVTLVLITVYFQCFATFYDFSSLFNEEYSLYIDTFSYSAFFILFLALLLALCNLPKISVKKAY